MTEIETRADEMREQVIAFHKEHPDVWELFVQFTMEKIEQGYNNYSVNAIFERIRWEKDAGGDGVTTFKLNNNYRAFYSRRFMRMYTDHSGFFRTRQQVSEDQSAIYLPEITPDQQTTGEWLADYNSQRAL